MKADRVKVSLGWTIPGPVQYESIRLDASFEHDVPEGGTRESAYQTLLAEAEELVKRTIKAYKAEMNGKSKK